MRLRKSIHGRDMIKDIIPQGLSIEETIEELKRKNWNANKIIKKAKITFEDCNIRMVLDKICICDSNEEIIKIITENILQLYDDQVGKRYACIYLVAFTKHTKPNDEINQTIRDICKKKKSIYHPKQIKKIIDYAIIDGKYLGLLNTDGSIKNQDFFLRWGYYHENQALDDIFRDYKCCMLDHDEKEWYYNAYRNRHLINNKIAKGEEFNFSNPIIQRKKIKKDGKIREVYNVEKKSYEYIVLKYLKKQLDIRFSIRYANRNSITRQLFALIEDIEVLSTYTIFRFDIKEFFESTDAKEIYDRYIASSKIDSSLKFLLQRLISYNNKCYAGLATSNALVEIAGQEFDNQIKAQLNKFGLIFYSRYVDDGLMIFNKNVESDFLEKIVSDLLIKCFGTGVQLHPTKRNYLQKANQDGEFDYLGYLFKKNNGIYKYGITEDKRAKYRQIMEKIVDEYLANSNIELLRQRIIYFISRSVFYNNTSSRYSNLGSWDVTGITANYCLLRNAILDETLEQETKKYLNNLIFDTIKNKLNPTGKVFPYVYFINNGSRKWYSINHGILKNKSIVFHPKIGWSSKYLCEQIRKLGYRGKLKSKPYRECVAIYYSIIKLQ